jgi:hypothetical protein
MVILLAKMEQNEDREKWKESDEKEEAQTLNQK